MVGPRPFRLRGRDREFYAVHPLLNVEREAIFASDRQQDDDSVEILRCNLEKFAPIHGWSPLGVLQRQHVSRNRLTNKEPDLLFGSTTKALISADPKLYNIKLTTLTKLCDEFSILFPRS